MNVILAAMIFVFVLIMLGAGAGIVVFLLMRKKSATWRAEIYQYRDATYTKGNVTLRDLKKVGEDTLIKKEMEEGSTVFLLQNLNRTTPEPSLKTTYEGKDGKRYVKVLFHKDSATLLEEGYHENSGTVVYNPLEYSRANMIINNMLAKKSRFKADQTTLEKITPFIVFGIAMVGIVALGYLMGNSWVKVSENYKIALEEGIQGQKEIAAIYIEASNMQLDKIRGITNELKIVVNQTRVQSIE